MGLAKIVTNQVAKYGSKMLDVAASQVAKNNALKCTKYIFGTPMTHYVKTGTEVLNTGGVKSVALGEGNKLGQYVKQIVSYPKGFLGNDKTKTIVLFGANSMPIYAGAPKEVGAFLKGWKGLVDVVKQSA